MEFKNKTVRKASISLRLQTGGEDQHYETSSQTVCIKAIYYAEYSILISFQTNTCLDSKSFEVFFGEMVFLSLNLPKKDIVLAPTIQIQVTDSERGTVEGTCDLRLDDYEALFLQKPRKNSLWYEAKSF